jgi:hypothetical protein
MEFVAKIARECAQIVSGLNNNYTRDRRVWYKNNSSRLEINLVVNCYAPPGKLYMLQEVFTV